MLCIRKSFLDEVHGIDKKTDMQKVLEDNCWFFNSEGEAIKSGYTPISIRVIVRSAYTNKVLIRKEDNELYLSLYKGPEELTKQIHRGMDYIMFQVGLMLVDIVKNVNYNVSKTFAYSAFLPIGVAHTDTLFPCILLQIVIKDDMLSSIESMLKDNYHFEDIMGGNKTHVYDDQVVKNEVVYVMQEGENEGI